MGYTVKLGRKQHGHYETKEEAYEAIKNLCDGQKPYLLHVLPDGMETYMSPQRLIIFVIPHPAASFKRLSSEGTTDQAFT